MRGGRFLKTKIEEVEDMLLNKDISPNRFNNIVNRYNGELININSEIEVIEGDKDTLLKYAEGGKELLVNLDQLFKENDYDGKRILAGSVLKKKLLFGNNGCRTTKVNEVIEVLTRSEVASGVRLNKTFRNGALKLFSAFTMHEHQSG